jgi:large subunit ribosomal protein L22
MEALAITKYLRISPFKARQVVRLIQGKPALQALSTLELMPRKAARMAAKTLRSAIANAENAEHDAADPAELMVKEAVVGEGPTMRRFRPKARGSAGRIRKRTSHIRVVVSDGK